MVEGIERERSSAREGFDFGLVIGSRDEHEAARDGALGGSFTT